MLAPLSTDDEHQLNVIASTEPIYNNLIVRRLLKAAQSGDQAALETLVSSHSRAVFKVVKRRYIYANVPAGGPDGIDLIQEGLYGLTNAVLRADTNSAAPFYAYAKRCIEGHILNCLVRAHAIHMPINYAGALYALPGKLEQGESLLTLDSKTLATRMNVTEATAEALRLAPVHPDSLDAPATPGHDRSLGETQTSTGSDAELNPIEHDILTALYLEGASHAQLAAELRTTERIIAAIAATSLARIGSPIPVAHFSGPTTSIARAYCALSFKAQTLLHLRFVAMLSPAQAAQALTQPLLSVERSTASAIAKINKSCEESHSEETVAAAIRAHAPLRAAILAKMPEQSSSVLSARLFGREPIESIAATHGIAVSRVKTLTTEAYAELTRDATTALLLAA